MEDPLDKLYVGMDCDNFEQFYFVLRSVWSEIYTENTLVSFNFVGWKGDNILPKRPKEYQENPLSKIGISVISKDPLTEQLLLKISDYRDPCFYEDGKMVLASSSDHLSIFTTLSKEFIERLHIDYIVQIQPGSIEDL
jgi:hypothetical protein